MKLEAEPYVLQFKRPFRISHGTRDHTPVVLIRATHGSYTGFGEAALPPYYPETLDSVLLFISNSQAKCAEIWDRPDELECWMENESTDPAARAGLEMALLDLYCRINDTTLREFLGAPQQSPPCSVTLAADTQTEMEEIIAEHPDHTLFKLKLTGNDDLRRLQWVRDRTGADLCVDVNGGWKDKDVALRTAEALQKQNVLFIEQPFRRADRDLFEATAGRWPLPVIADESIRTPDELEGFRELVDGVNVKLMKSPGIFRSRRIMTRARELGMKVLIGCMSESGCGTAAAAALQGWADWADLDGPLLIRNDPFRGTEYSQGKLKVIGEKGIGVELKVK